MLHCHCRVEAGMTIVDCKITAFTDEDPFNSARLIEAIKSAMDKVIDDKIIGDNYAVDRWGSYTIGTPVKGNINQWHLSTASIVTPTCIDVSNCQGHIK